MLGVIMLTGLVSVAPDMRGAGNAYFRAQNLCDLRVVSTLGLTERDVQQIAKVQGVQSVMPVKTVDAEVTNNIGDTLVMRAQGLPAIMDETDDRYINRFVIEEGRLPETAGECAVHPLGFIEGIELGDEITLPEEAEGLAGRTFTVVGVVQNPTNFSIDDETTTAGDGMLDFLAFFPAESLTADYYTTCYLTVEGADALDTYSDEYDALLEPVVQRLEKLAIPRAQLRQSEVVGEAQAELDDAKQEYEDAKAEVEAELADAEQKLADAKKELEQGEKEYADGVKELAKQKQDLPANLQQGADQLVISEGQVLEFEEQVDQITLAVEMLAIAGPLLDYAEDALQDAEEDLNALDPNLIPNYDEYLQSYNDAKRLYDEISTRVSDYQAQLDQAKVELYNRGITSSPDLTNEQLRDECKAKLREMKLALSKGQLSVSTGVATAYAAFEKAEEDLAEARETLDEGWLEYEDGVKEYEEGKAEAEAELADAFDKITDAQEQIDDIAACEWYVLDRDTLTSFVSFELNADRIADIAKVFPVFFFLVAALVALTTMTRMVEENRLQIGALKALGYSEGEITAKYLLYALVASLAGAVVGIALGFFLIPAVVWIAYSQMFQLPTFQTVYYPWLIAVSIAASTLVILAATLNACHASLREKPASLLMPKAPAAGKRIFLEHITPLWNRMSFSYKVTARNLLRYKKRFYMTLLGVAGCTALLLVGFGLQDSIMEVVDYQFANLNHYDLSVTISNEKALTVERGLSDILEDPATIQSSGLFYTKNVTILNEDGQEGSLTLTMAESTARMTDYFTFRNRLGGSAIDYDETSVILTEKTAETLGVKAGDTIRLETDAGRVPLTVTGVTENYIFSRIFIGPKAYEQAVGPVPAWNTVLAKTAGTIGQEEASRLALTETILQKNYVSGVSFIGDATAAFTNTIQCIDYVVLLIIVLAAALAAIVLYNLININIAERKKELATIKVLGFYNHEVQLYIFREILINAFLGALAGIGLGLPLHQFIVRTVEIDQMMFMRSIQPSSGVYSVALTMVFTLAVCLWMRRQVNGISMVESMKAPE
ncbi:MAG: ABC transporter permease [Faecalibacterium sp.]|nr:ABC transporter permease [Faecalibacterium sp.]